MNKTKAGSLKNKKKTSKKTNKQTHKHLIDQPRKKEDINYQIQK